MRRVVKIGGRAQNDPALPRMLAEVVRSGDELVVVHGGGDEVTALQRRLGSEPTFIGGRRVTTDEDMEVVRMVLSGAVNKRLVRQLLGEGVAAIGISGEDGGLLPAQLLDGGALGAVGEPLNADPRPVEALLSAGFVPVVSPLGRHAETGKGLNINGDDAAAAIAGALGADELLLLADVPGVLDAAGSLVPSIPVDTVDDMIASGIARGGMSAKLQAARRAIAAGVSAVRISDAGALLDPDAGTRLTTAHSPA
ncbi:MAG TPA: acetylglutamate kinase [Gemmatimonadaceae bacterium]